MGLTANGEQVVLNALLASVHVALYNGDPEGAGTEVVGNGYARRPATFTQTGNNPTTAANSALIQFATATGSWGNITHAALFSAATAGNMLAGITLDVSKQIEVDDVVRFLAGQLKVTAQ